MSTGLIRPKAGGKPGETVSFNLSKYQRVSSAVSLRTGSGNGGKMSNEASRRTITLEHRKLEIKQP